MEYSADGLKAQIDVVKTAELYRILQVDTDSSSAAVNFRRNISMHLEKIRNYLEPYGISAYAYRDLSVVSINQQEQSVTYCGYYQAVFENEEEIKASVKADHENFEAHIDFADFGFEFSFECIDGHVVLFFWAEIPWLMPVPIAKSRYTNRATLPLLQKCT